MRAAEGRTRQADPRDEGALGVEKKGRIGDAAKGIRPTGTGQDRSEPDDS